MAADLEKREKKEVTNSASENIIDSSNSYAPDADIFVSDDEALFAFDVPGVEKGNVKIEIDENDNLIVKAENSFKEEDRVAYRQYNVGNYYRAFQLSEGYDKDNIKAELENGLLKVTVPKKEEAKPRKIEISA